MNKYLAPAGTDSNYETNHYTRPELEYLATFGSADALRNRIAKERLKGVGGTSGKGVGAPSAGPARPVGPDGPGAAVKAGGAGDWVLQEARREFDNRPEWAGRHYEAAESAARQRFKEWERGGAQYYAGEPTHHTETFPGVDQDIRRHEVLRARRDRCQAALGDVRQWLTTHGASPERVAGRKGVSPINRYF
jgi:hypothetical protein